MRLQLGMRPTDKNLRMTAIVHIARPMYHFRSLRFFLG